MATPKGQEKLEEENINKLDFTKIELDYILQNANFNDIQLKVFNRLTDKHGRQKIYQIAMEENISERTVCRIIKQIKNKIKRLIRVSFYITNKLKCHNKVKNEAMLWQFFYAKNKYNIIKIYQKRKEILREMKKGYRNMYKVYNAQVISSFYMYNSYEN